MSRRVGVSSASFRFVALAGMVLLAPSCGPQPVARHFEDFVTSGAGDLPRSELWCGDRTQYGFSLGSGESVRLEFAAGSQPRLVVGACSERRQPGARLSLAVVDSDATAGEPGGEWKLDLPGPPAWRRAEFDLGRWAGRRGQLVVTAAAPAGGAIRITDLYLEDRRPVAAGAPGRRQILLISIDTLREDALAALGGRVATPQIDALAARAEIWKPHYAAASWTKPSHASLLTGQYPHVHGANDLESVIDPALPTLAERIRAAGIRTAAQVRHVILAERFGFARGFDEYRVVDWQAAQQTREAANWMAANRNREFFYFLHLMEVHSDFRALPYEAPGVTRRLVAQRFGVPGYGCRSGRCSSILLAAINRGEVQPIAGEAAILRFLYEEGVRHVDAALGLLFEQLRELDMLDDMIVVLTSDHGESFLEHGMTMHEGPWEEVLRVPLLIKWPSDRERSTPGDTPTSSLDVAPTLLAALGLPLDGLPGRPLDRRRGDVPVIAETGWRMIRQGALKAVFEPGGPSESRLFDLRADSGERRDVAGERGAEVARLRDLLERQLAAAGASRPPLVAPLSEEERARLRALGYVSPP